jgi:hypothetical protein
VTRLLWVFVAFVVVARGVGAFFLPLTGDEAYYWEWSRRLAFGYVDHPPAVAWTIRAFAAFGQEPGLVRLGFVLCGVFATSALAWCASLIARDSRAGAVTALVFSLTPLMSVVFGSATPDGPFLLFWCFGLLFAVRAFRFGRRADFVLLGIALGGVLLSRMFGFALVAGIAAYAIAPARREVWRRGLWLSFVLAGVLFVPFLAWNAEHGWVTFAFALVHRHQDSRSGFSLTRLGMLYLAIGAAYSPGIWAAALVCAFRPRDALLSWTALPLLGLLTAMALFGEVEIHWVVGPFASLCAEIGVAFTLLGYRPRIVWATVAVVPAAALLPFIFAMVLAPGSSYDIVQRETSLKLRNSGPFEIFAFALLAKDVARIAHEHHAIVMTDGYGLSSVLDFDAAVSPVVIGYNWQGRESRAWYPSSMRPNRALFVDKEPLATRPDFAQRLALACGRVIDGGARTYRYHDAPPRAFYFTWCEGLRPDGLAILRWEAAS